MAELGIAIENARAYVTRCLEEYHGTMRKIAQLRYELENLTPCSSAETIESMNFDKSGDGRHPTGHVSDKTAYIAMNYAEEMKRVDSELFAATVLKLAKLEEDVRRLDYYISLLEPREAAVIRSVYLERRSMDELSPELKVSTRTLRKIKSNAIDVLAEMYDFMGVTGQAKP